MIFKMLINKKYLFVLKYTFIGTMIGLAYTQFILKPISQYNQRYMEKEYENLWKINNKFLSGIKKDENEYV